MARYAASPREVKAGTPLCHRGWGVRYGSPGDVPNIESERVSCNLEHAGRSVHLLRRLEAAAVASFQADGPIVCRLLESPESFTAANPRSGATWIASNRRWVGIRLSARVDAAGRRLARIINNA